MTQTQYFEWLGAPLVNIRWSWGSLRSDGILFLRVWQDETIRHEGIRYVRVTRHSAFVGDESNLGYQERLKHLEMIRKGARCYLVMCEPDTEKLPERVIKDFNSDELFEAGRLAEIDGDSWLELKSRTTAMSLRT